MWKHVQAAPPDAILGLTEAFKNDPRPGKVNLGVGVYKDEKGATPVLASVHAAEQRIFNSEKSKAYMPIAGDPVYSDEVQKMIFGSLCDRSGTAHAPGGTGALRLGGELLKEFGGRTFWISRPTWENHRNLFAACGLTVKEYPYYDPASKDLDRDAFFDALRTIPAGDCVLLHACCHNPSGVDLTPEQWNEVARLAAANGWMPFIDFAYQGFGESIEADRAGIEALRSAGVEFMVASSFSKNFGLYRERTGALTVVAASAGDAAVAMSHVKKTARVIYSNPPAHGGMIVTTILKDADLSSLWRREVDAMRGRIAAMRAALAAGLAARGVPMDCSFMTRQRGMFSFSGLNKEQVDFLRDQKAIYIVGSGRINVAGLTPGNMDAVCDAVAEAMKR